MKSERIVRLWPYGIKSGMEVLMVDGSVGMVDCEYASRTAGRDGCVPVLMQDSRRWVPADDIERAPDPGRKPR